MQYHVRLFRYLFSDERTFSVRLEKEITLPFVPSVTISLGLDDGSTFCHDQEKVKDVMWIVPLGEFHVEIKELRSSALHCKECCDLYIKDGWVAHLGFSFHEANGALQSAKDFEDSMVVCLKGEFFVLTHDEFYSLQKDGRDFTIISDESQGG